MKTKNMDSFRFIAVMLVFIPSILFGQTKKSYKVSKKMEKQFLEITPAVGGQFVSFKRNNISGFDAKISFPENFKSNDSTLYPLVIALHWAGNGKVYQEHSECLIEPAFADVHPIIIAPSGEGQVWHTPENEKKVLELTNLALKHWPVDPTKVIVAGYSNGGNGSWYYAEHYPALFTAGIAMASAYQPKGKIDIPLYVIHGSEDELFPYARTKKWVDESKMNGSNIIWKLVPRKSHFMACGYVAELKEAVEWVMGK